MRNVVIYELLIPSLMKLYEMDYNNILIGVSERNICGRLAHHIENVMRQYDRKYNSDMFSRYYADVEYDKMNDGNQKHYENSQHQATRMVSDLLIHSRGVPDNLLAVEMKRKKSYDKRRKDRERLKAMVATSSNIDVPCVYNTLLGAFIIYSPEDVKVEIYENENVDGDKMNELRFIYTPEKTDVLTLIVNQRAD